MAIPLRLLAPFLSWQLALAASSWAGLVTYQFEAQVTSAQGSLFGTGTPAFGATFTGSLTYDASATPTDPGYWIDNLGAVSRLAIQLNGQSFSTLSGELDAFSELGWVEFGSAEGGDFPEGLLLNGTPATADGYLFLALVTDSVSIPDGSLNFPLAPLSQWDSPFLSPMLAIGDNLAGGYVERETDLDLRLRGYDIAVNPLIASSTRVTSGERTSRSIVVNYLCCSSVSRRTSASSSAILL